MLMHDRDMAITQAVGRFGQLAAGHIRRMFFSDNSSLTPVYRALNRLTDSKYLAKIERRMVGGSGAGSGQYVYQLGSKGWEFAQREGRYWPARSVSHHGLAIADVFTSFLELERRGAITIDNYETEPDAHRTISGAKLTPDLFIQFSVAARRQTVSLWLEVDLGNERQRQLSEKLARYWHAYQFTTAAQLDVFPAVFFLVPDQMRKRQLELIIQRGEPEARKLFHVGLLAGFPGYLLAE